MSCHRFMANYFRLFMCSVALNLLIRLRQATALPKQKPRSLQMLTETVLRKPAACF